MSEISFECSGSIEGHNADMYVSVWRIRTHPVSFLNRIKIRDFGYKSGNNYRPFCNIIFFVTVAAPARRV